MKCILFVAVVVFFSSCGVFQRNSYMMRRIDKYDYKHNRYFFYSDNTNYNIGDTITVEGFKAVISDARY